MESSEYQQAHGEYVYEGVTLSRFFQPIERVNAGQAYTNWRKGDLVLKTFPKSGKKLGFISKQVYNYNYRDSVKIGNFTCMNFLRYLRQKVSS